MFSFDITLMYALLFVLTLIFVDVVLGVAVSLQNGTFSLAKLPVFLETQILPYYMSLIILSLLAQLKDVQSIGTMALAWSSIAAYTVKIIWVDILSKVKTLFIKSSLAKPSFKKMPPQ
jgi:hypothetical protein